MSEAGDRWRGRVVLVTGSSSGIGATVARLFAGLGAAVLVNSARSTEAGQAVADSLPDALYVQANVADEAQCTRLVRTALDRWGRLDLLVNNAGTGPVIAHADLAAASVAVWREVFEVNLFGAWALTVAAAPALAEQEGAIVNVSSLAGIRQRGSSIPYACSKAAMNHMTKLTAAVLGQRVRVNAVAPGLVDTPRTEGWDDSHANYRATAPLRRVVTSDEVAHVVLFLAEAPAVTGEVVVIDSGAGLVR